MAPPARCGAPIAPVSHGEEREYFRMAGWYLIGRWRVMGNVLEGDPYGVATPWDLYMIGMLDAGAEMREIIDNRTAKQALA